MDLPADSLIAAGITFAGVLPDSTVLALLRRYNLRPYSVHTLLSHGPSLHDTSPDSARPELIAEARQRAIRGAAEAPCFLQGRLRSELASQRHIQPAPGERGNRWRMRLAELENVRETGERLRRGEPFVFGLRVVGRTADLRRLTHDPLVRGLRLPQRVINGDPYVPAPEPPGAAPLPGRPSSPEVDRLSDAEVQARLEALLRAPLPGCEARDQNLRETAAAKPVNPDYSSPEGLTFRTTSRVTAEIPAGIQGAPQIRATVTVTNQTGRTIQTMLRGCTTMPRLYRGSAPPDAPPVWDRSHNIGCMQDPYPLSLGPGASKQFEVEPIEAWHVLSDSVPAGRYRITVLFRLADRTLELPAGYVEITPGFAGLAFRASARVGSAAQLSPLRLPFGSGVLRAEASVTNTTPRPIHIEYGACALRIRGYRNPERTGRPAFDSDRRAPYEETFAYGCPAYGAQATIQPGQTFSPGEFRNQLPVIELLGDSLPNAQYHLAASLEINGVRTPEFPAGEVRLEANRPPLPESRIVRFATHRANTRVLPGGRVRAEVMVTLTHAGGSLQRFSRDCAVTLYVYRTRERRDAAPRSGAPDWQGPRRRCGPELQEFSMRRGESRTLAAETTVQEILGDSLPPGRYYFAVAVQGEGTRFLISAGEANLSR